MKLKDYLFATIIPITIIITTLVAIGLQNLMMVLLLLVVLLLSELHLRWYKKDHLKGANTGEEVLPSVNGFISTLLLLLEAMFGFFFFWLLSYTTIKLIQINLYSIQLHFFLI